MIYWIIAITLVCLLGSFIGLVYAGDRVLRVINTIVIIVFISGIAFFVDL